MKHVFMLYLLLLEMNCYKIFMLVFGVKRSLPLLFSHEKCCQRFTLTFSVDNPDAERVVAFFFHFSLSWWRVLPVHIFPDIIKSFFLHNTESSSFFFFFWPRDGHHPWKNYPGSSAVFPSDLGQILRRL